MENKDKRTIHSEYNTLSSVIINLKGYRTTFELFNDAYVVGRIVDADGKMNVTLDSVTYTDANGKSFDLQHFFVKGRKIRYAHIPEEVDVMKTLEEALKPRGAPKHRESLRSKIQAKRDLQTLKRYQRQKKESNEEDKK